MAEFEWTAKDARDLLLVKGYEAAFLPSRCLNADETRILNGRLVGAIGISGGSVEQDGQAAKAGANSLK